MSSFKYNISILFPDSIKGILSIRMQKPCPYYSLLVPNTTHASGKKPPTDIDFRSFVSCSATACKYTQVFQRGAGVIIGATCHVEHGFNKAATWNRTVALMWNVGNYGTIQWQHEELYSLFLAAVGSEYNFCDQLFYQSFLKEAKWQVNAGVYRFQQKYKEQHEFHKYFRNKNRNLWLSQRWWWHMK